MPNPNTAKPVVATFFSEWAGQWLRGMLSGSALQIIAIVLAVIAGVGFIAAGLAMFDFLLPHDWWRALAIASSVVSLILCVALLEYLPHRGAGGCDWHHCGGGLDPVADGGHAGLLGQEVGSIRPPVLQVGESRYNGLASRPKTR